MIRLLSRESLLALCQTIHVMTELKKVGVESSIITKKTAGDINLKDPLYQMPAKGAPQAKAIFIKELEDGLLNEQGEAAVHSLKDLPTTLPHDLMLATVCLPEDDRDLLISKKPLSLTELPKLRIGTSSLRRIEQLKEHFPGSQFSNLRGNVLTRLEKLLKTNEYEAIVLATAGLKRLMHFQKTFHELKLASTLDDKIIKNIEADMNRLQAIQESPLYFYLLDKACCLPAVSQGKLGIETHKKNSPLNLQLNRAFHTATKEKADAEQLRELLNVSEAGCHAAFGAYIEQESVSVYFKSEKRIYRGRRNLALGIQPLMRELKGQTTKVLWTASNQQLIQNKENVHSLPLTDYKYLNPLLPNKTENLVVASQRVVDNYSSPPLEFQTIFAPGPATAAYIKEKWNQQVIYPTGGLGVEYLVQEKLIDQNLKTVLLGSSEKSKFSSWENYPVYEIITRKDVTFPFTNQDEMVILALTSPATAKAALKLVLPKNYYIACYGEQVKKLLDKEKKPAYIYHNTGTIAEFLENILLTSPPAPLTWEEKNWQTL